MIEPALLYGVSVFLPCHNEEGNIERVAAGLETELPRIGERYEIIVVDDGSRDRTGEIAERAVATTEKEQGFAVDGRRLLDFADIDGVVAAGIGRGKLALDISQRALKDRGPVGAGPVGHALEFRAAADREAARQRFLVVGQDVHREDLALLEVGIALSLLVDGDEQ